jgi:hypothetical protein
MIKLKKKLDLVKVVCPTILEKIKKKKQEFDYKNLEKAFVEKLLLLFMIDNPIQNLFIHSHPSEKKQEDLFMDRREEIIK